MPRGVIQKGRGRAALLYSPDSVARTSQGVAALFLFYSFGLGFQFYVESISVLG